MTTNNPAKAIREELRRAHGWGPRQVSVRSDSGSVRVEIKAPGVPLRTVQAIAKQHEDIRRCEASGEILLGGNTYVSVTLSWELIRPLERILTEWAEALPQDGTTLAPCAEAPDILVWRHDRYDFRVEDNPDAIPTPCMGANTAATVVATWLIERGITEIGTLPAPQSTYTSEPNEVPQGQERPIHDPKDEACRLDAGGDCLLCGMHHGSACSCCGGRAYCRSGCTLSTGMEATFQALIGVEVLLDPPDRPGAPWVHGRIRRAENGALQVDVFGGELVWRSVADLEPAFPGDVPLGAPVVFTPWATEGPNEPTPGYIFDLRGFMLVVQSLASPAIQVQRLPASLTQVIQDDCPACQGWGWLVVRGEARVESCDRCGRYDDETATAAAIAHAASRGVSLASLFAA
jgi:hypothetical protein